MTYLAFVDIDNVTDVLEGKKRNADRQQYFGGIETRGPCKVIGELCQVVDNLMVGVEDIVVYVGKEVGVFKVEKDEQVDDDAGNHQCFPFSILSFPFIHPNTEEIAEECGENKQQDEKSRGLEIEEQTNKEEITVAKGQLGERRTGTSRPGLRPTLSKKGCTSRGRAENKTIARKDKQEEGPEVELGEKEWMLLVETEEINKKCN